MLVVDLHCHSKFSDGTFSPEALVRRAARRHVSVLGLTDHDTTAGLVRFMAACKRRGSRELRGSSFPRRRPIPFT